LNLKKAIQTKNVKLLCKFLFKVDLVAGQIDIVRRIAYGENKRLSISAMTRYGKSYCVAIGIGLYILFNKNKRIAIIAPTGDQTKILRNYLSEMVLSNTILSNLADLDGVGTHRLKREASSNRLTFKNGCEYQVFSAHGDANSLMGWGADVVIKDEACLITRVANTKIMRMLGDDPENSILIELYNPWERDNPAFEHTLDPDFHVIHIGWEQAMREGRTTLKFITSQRKDLTPLEFVVLYDSDFPEQGEDSLFAIDWITAAEKLTFGFQAKLNEVLKMYKDVKSEVHNLSESQYHKKLKPIKEELSKFTKVVSCDPAEKGLDETVSFWGIKYENNIEVIGTWNQARSDPMKVVGKIVDIALNFIEPEIKGRIHWDRIGIGSGPLSRCKEVIREKGRKNIKVLGCHFGESAMKKDIFHNKKAENYFRLADMMRNNMIAIPVELKLRNQLIAEKWDRTSSNRKIVIDPKDNSPDWGDGLVYLAWEDKIGMKFGFA